MDRDLFIETAVEREWLARFDENQQWIKTSAKQADKESRLNHELIDWLLEHGYNRLSLPAARGGFGCDIKSVILLQEVLASYDESTALAIGWHLGIVGEVFGGNLWSAEMMEQFTEHIVNGGIANRVVSEAETGSPTRGGKPATHAVRHEDGWLLNGVKTYVSMSHRLTHYIVGTFVEEKKAMCFFYVPAHTAGAEIVETWNVMGMRATASHDLILTDVFVLERYLVEVSRKGQENPWLMHIPSVYLGIAQGAHDDAVQFALAHSPNSIQGVIADLPHIEMKLGEMELKLMTARHFLYHAAQLTSENNLGPTFSATKYIVVNYAQEIVDIAMRIMGAKSLEQDGITERRYRSVRAGLHNPPMDDAVIRLLAQQAKNQLS
ncbi:acyl-CoA dehydrogenase family protein [Macrococcus equipercicus]|uniref:Acyl-CoA/acyl-ACP dehydrogenase n=1 Tax=Macrococcus equipercicus TaxID=69967 RepID=A0A9Q9F3F8_9STAP|nr:acyl-CoA dehydrogenase family protein [Macrococcus equipercicus]UTH13949.1 acyl-CoA/acyl-ACP dehydrogenase [Macrococcus equipercicus]